MNTKTRTIPRVRVDPRYRWADDEHVVHVASGRMMTPAEYVAERAAEEKAFRIEHPKYFPRDGHGGA
jgi:hypothetical protein